ncbi:hypothetical protein C5167_043546 [Papaver somniferum]|uniref:Uncharacterized protein n=1 Tax=Papaver somniferum TaxID=3469 RepID=A0A4Y7L9W1_PAPSO|nr:hypothetical protein C5167_043546 [Papaver somniferum]
MDMIAVGLTLQYEKVEFLKAKVYYGLKELPAFTLVVGGSPVYCLNSSTNSSGGENETVRAHKTTPSAKKIWSYKQHKSQPAPLLWLRGYLLEEIMAYDLTWCCFVLRT